MERWGGPGTPGKQGLPNSGGGANHFCMPQVLPLDLTYTSDLGLECVCIHTRHRATQLILCGVYQDLIIEQIELIIPLHFCYL